MGCLVCSFVVVGRFGLVCAIVFGVSVCLVGLFVCIALDCLVAVCGWVWVLRWVWILRFWFVVLGVYACYWRGFRVYGWVFVWISCRGLIVSVAQLVLL